MCRARPTSSSARRTLITRRTVSDNSGHRLPIRHELDVLRTKAQHRLAGATSICGEAEPAPLEHHRAVLDGNGKTARIADETVDEGAGRLVINRIRIADLLDPAASHDHDPIGELERLLLVMGDEHRGVAGLVVDLAQPAAQVAAHLGIERPERLIEQQHPRFDGERPGERHALPLAAGELRREAVAKAGELHQLEKLERRACGLRSPPGAAPRGRTLQAEGDIVENRHMAEQRIVLEHEADIAVPCTLSAEASSLPNQISPAVGISSPAISRSNVVLPEPDGPSSARSSPERISSDTPCSAGNAVERLDDVCDAKTPSAPQGWRLRAASSAPKRHSNSVFMTSVTSASMASSEATAKAAAK